MKKIFIPLFIIFLTTAQAAGTVRIIATADLHGDLPALAELAPVIRRYPDAFKVDAGDLTQSSPVCDIEPPGAMLDALNELGYDIFVPGNHDFEWGVERMKFFARNFRGKILMGQCTEADIPSAGWIVAERGGVRCAFIGLTEDGLLRWKRFFPEYSFRTDTLDLLREILSEIKKVKPYPDAVVLIWHSSFYSKFGSLGQILRGYPEIDAVICAHSHRESPGMKAASALAAQPGARGSSAVLVEIKTDGEKRKIITSKLLRQERYPDRKLNALWQRAKKEKGAVMAEKLYEADNADELKKICAEKIRKYCSADAVILGMYDLRGDRAVTAREIMKLMPYNNRICLIEAEPELLETVKKEKIRYGGNIYVSTPETKDGKRITIAVNDYLLRSSEALKKYVDKARITPFYERGIILDNNISKEKK